MSKIRCVSCTCQGFIPVRVWHSRRPVGKPVSLAGCSGGEREAGCCINFYTNCLLRGCLYKKLYSKTCPSFSETV